MQKSFFCFFVLWCLISCQQSKIEHVERAFYYWKSNESSFKEEEKILIDTLKIKKVYVKFFEVIHDETLGNIPVSKTELNSFSWIDINDKKDSLEIIPTVFIKNDVFLKSSKSELDTLASNVNYLVKKYFKERFFNHFENKEIQMDCDWTLKSKENYFYFLKSLGKMTKKELSCTLRLYPFKYRTKMGIPPVNKASLMCYNLIQPFSDASKNSILDISELEAYLTVDQKYPIHLDVALPVFSWGFHYQYDEFKGFVNIQKAVLPKFAIKKNEFWYEVKKDTTVNDVYYRMGDKIKYEAVTIEMLERTILLLQKKCKFDKTTTITLFHLDQNLTATFDYETLNHFYTSFSK